MPIDSAIALTPVDMSVVIELRPSKKPDPLDMNALRSDPNVGKEWPTLKKLSRPLAPARELSSAIAATIRPVFFTTFSSRLFTPSKNTPAASMKSLRS